MNELTINGTVYNFKFGFGFIRKIGGAYKVPVAGIPNATKDAGLVLAIANVYDGDLIELVRILDVANEGQKPRITRAELEEYIESEETDIDELINTVIDFLSKANCCKEATKQVLQMAEEQEKAKQGA